MRKHVIKLQLCPTSQHRSIRLTVAAAVSVLEQDGEGTVVKG
jgi:hypothetical protein